MTPEERYDELVRQVAETGRIWLLEDEAGLVGSVGEDGRRYLAVWPDADAAEACAIGPWKGAQPVAMNAAAALHAIGEREGMLAVHPTREDEGFPVEAGELSDRLVD